MPGDGGPYLPVLLPALGDGSRHVGGASHGGPAGGDGLPVEDFAAHAGGADGGQVAFVDDLDFAVQGVGQHLRQFGFGAERATDTQRSLCLLMHDSMIIRSANSTPSTTPRAADGDAVSVMAGRAGRSGVRRTTAARVRHGCGG